MVFVYYLLYYGWFVPVFLGGLDVVVCYAVCVCFLFAFIYLGFAVCFLLLWVSVLLWLCLGFTVFI